MGNTGTQADSAGGGRCAVWSLIEGMPRGCRVGIDECRCLERQDGLGHFFLPTAASATASRNFPLVISVSRRVGGALAFRFRIGSSARSGLVSTRVSTAAAGIRRKLSWRWTGLEFCDLFSQLCCESAPDSCSLRRIFLHLAKLPLKIGRRNNVSKPIAVFTNDLHEVARSEEHTSELQSLMRISYAVFCLKK